MVDETKKVKLDETYTDDLDFEFDDIDIGPKIPEGRDAVKTLPTHVASGAMNALIGPDKRRSLILNSLPNEYREAYSNFTTIRQETKSIYRTAKNELRNSKRELKAAGREVLPMLKAFMPKRLYDHLDKITQERTWAQIDPKQAELDSAMSSVFGQQTAATDASSSQDYAEQQISKKANEIRQDRLYEMMAGMANNISDLSSYNRSIGNEYRRKMLEVNYRMLFALTDTLQVTKTATESMVPALEAIVKNTALPDYAKEEFTEIQGALLKRKIAEAISPATYARGFISKFGADIRGKMGEFFNGAREMLSEAGQMASMASNASDDNLTDAQQRTKLMQTAAGMAGGVFANKFIAPHVNKAQKWVKQRLNEKQNVVQFGNKLAYELGGLTDHINTALSDQGYEGDGSVASKIVKRVTDILGWAMPAFEGESMSMTGWDASSLGKASKWSNRSDLTLNTIIPQALAKIDQSIRRLTDPNAQLEQYDVAKLKWVNTTELHARIAESFADRETKNSLRAGIDGILDTIDPDKNLSEEDRDTLRKTINDKIRKVKRFNVSDLAQRDAAYESQEFGDLFDLNEHFSDIVKAGNADSINRQVTNEIQRLRGFVDTFDGKANNIAELYGQDALIRAGVFTPNHRGFAAHDDLYDTWKDFNGASTDTVTPPPVTPSAINLQVPPPPTTQTATAMVSKDYQLKVMRAALYGADAKPDVNMQTLLRAPKDAAKSTKSTTQSTGTLEQILAQLKENNAKQHVINIETLMQDILEHGGFGVRLIPGFKRSARWAGGKIKAGWGKFTGYIGRAKSFIAEHTKWDAIKSMGSKALSMARTGINAFGKSVLGIDDLYDETGKVFLSGRLMAEGYYRDAEGKVIKKWKDIKGAIYSPDGKIIYPAEIVNEKIAGLRALTSKGWQRITDTMFSLTGKTLHEAIDIPFKLGRQLKRLVIKGYHHATTSVDVYAKVNGVQEPSPRLRRSMMISGYYVSMQTGKAIRSVHDIDGPVITKLKEQVITADELNDPKFELVDVEGQPIKTLWQRVKDTAVAVGKFGWNVAKKPWEWARSGAGWLKDGAASLWEMLTGGSESGKGKKFKFNFGFGGNGSDKIRKRLDDIYELLKQRLGGGPKFKTIDPTKRRASADNDGDGVRDNSYIDIFRRRRAERAERDAKRGSNGTIAAAAGKVKDAAGSMWDWVKNAGNRFGDAVMGVFSNKLGPLFTKVISNCGPILTRIIKRAKAVTSVAKRAVGGVLGWAARGSMALLAGGAEWLAGAAIGVITSPWVIAAAVIGGAGYIAYKVATRKAPPLLDQLRFAQYGTEDYARADLDDVAKLRWLEDVMLKYTSYDNSGIAKINGISAKDLEAILSKWGVKAGDKDATDMFHRWLMSRFLPVYLLWVTRAKQLAPVSKFADIGALGYTLQKKILNGVTISVDHPIFRIETGPFDDEDLLDGEDVKDVEKEVTEYINDKVKVQDQIAKTGNRLDTPTETKIKHPELNSYTTGETATTGYSYQTVRPKSLAPKPKTAVDTMSKAALTGPNDLDHPANTVVIRNINAPKGRHVDKTINALDSIRLKTYGLTQLTADKVDIIYKLEELAYPLLVKSGQEYIFKGDLTKLVMDGCAYFGINKSDERQLPRFLAWLQYRFIPVFLNYVSSLDRVLPNANPFALVISAANPELYDVARLVWSTRSEVDGEKINIWDITYSPWPDNSPINNNPTTTDGNMEYLYRLKKEYELKQQSANETESKGDGRKTVGVKVNNGQQPRNAPTTTYGNKMLDTIFGGKAAVDTSGVAGYNTDRSVMPDLTGGVVGSGVKGEGGYYDIKRPANNPSGYAEMIRAVAKLTGMDPNLLLSVCMMESSFKNDARPGTSTAKGLFQFTDPTWNMVMSQHANAYGIPANASPYDPVANAILGAEYIRTGMDNLKSLGRPINATDIYLTHLLGTNGGARFLSNMAANPSGIAQVDFKKQAKANAGVFGDPGSGFLTYAQAYNKLQRRMRTAYANTQTMGGGDADQTAPGSVDGTPARVKTSLGSVATTQAAAAAVNGTSVADTTSPTVVGNLAAAKAANDAKFAVSNTASTVDVGPVSTTATAIDDKPYISAAANTAKRVAIESNVTAGVKAANDATQRQLSLVKVAAPIQAESNAAASVINRAAAVKSETDALLKEQLGVQQEMLAVLKNISELVKNRPVATAAPMQATKPTSSAPVITHDRAPISVSR